jgi:polyferredoxin
MLPLGHITQMKNFEKRLHDNSQVIRRTVQLAFLLFNAWIGFQFYLFVRYYETGGRGFHATRPSGIEGWLPIASLMNLKVFIETGELPRIHPAGMWLLIAFLAISWLLRKSFCSWLCPIGTLSEGLWRAGRQIFRRNWALPRWLDLTLRPLKYLLASFFVYIIATMPAEAIQAFLQSPYGIVADVKLLNFFRFMSTAAAITLAVFAIASIFIQNFWCRYLCPYGALLGVFSTLSPMRIKRQVATCIDCGKCARACPSLLPVDKLITIQSAECTACLICVAACPVSDALELNVARRPVPAWALASAVAAIFLGVCGYAQWSGAWHTNLPEAVYTRFVPQARDLDHP